MGTKSIFIVISFLHLFANTVNENKYNVYNYFIFLIKNNKKPILQYFRWYFALISISGIFAVTFSVVFAYVADVTDESNRSTAYGLVI
jgi:hypothetical protein